MMKLDIGLPTVAKHWAELVIQSTFSLVVLPFKPMSTSSHTFFYYKLSSTGNDVLQKSIEATGSLRHDKWSRCVWKSCANEIQ